MMDKDKFCLSFNALMTYCFNRERNMRDALGGSELIPEDPLIRQIVNAAEYKAFTDEVHDYVKEVIESSGLDSREYAEISIRQGQEKEKKIEKHKEWYYSQEFDV
jgi:hypothetical protein